jgi:hypothetical protein
MASLTVKEAGKALGGLGYAIRLQYEGLPGEETCCTAHRWGDLSPYWHTEHHDLQKRANRLSGKLYAIKERRARKAYRLRLSRQMARYTRLGIKWKMGVL